MVCFSSSAPEMTLSTVELVIEATAGTAKRQGRGAASPYAAHVERTLNRAPHALLVELTAHLDSLGILIAGQKRSSCIRGLVDRKVG